MPGRQVGSPAGDEHPVDDAKDAADLIGGHVEKDRDHPRACGLREGGEEGEEEEECEEGRGAMSERNEGAAPGDFPIPLECWCNS